MDSTASATPVVICLTVLLALLAIAWRTSIVEKRRKRRARSDQRPLVRVYESRLLAACSGNMVAVHQLIADELKRRPKLSRLEATKRAYRRLKESRRAVS
jgi:hypothetical protein